MVAKVLKLPRITQMLFQRSNKQVTLLKDTTQLQKSYSPVKAESPFKVKRYPRPKKIIIEKLPTTPKDIFGGYSRSKVGDLAGGNDEISGGVSDVTSQVSGNIVKKPCVPPRRLSGKTLLLVQKLKDKEKLKEKEKLKNKEKGDQKEKPTNFEDAGSAAIKITDTVVLDKRKVEEDNSEQNKPTISITSILSVDEKLVLDKYIKCS